MADPQALQTKLLVLAIVFLTVIALKVGYDVAMPLAAAAIVLSAIWPIKTWLNRFLPSFVSYLGTIAFLFLIAAGFLGAVYFSAAQVISAFAQTRAQFYTIYASLSQRAAQLGLPPLNLPESYNRLLDFGQTLLSNGYAVFVYLGFIAILVMLGLLEVAGTRDKLTFAFGQTRKDVIVTIVDDVSVKVRQYLAVTTLTSAMTGLASALWAMAMGLELALVWGVLNFLLNFIPVVGNIIGIVPPSLYAALQFQSASAAAVVFVGFTLLQVTISNFVYPTLQGSRLALSPVVILASLAFWTWLWGIAGALLAVPLTAAIVIVCDHFDSARWIAQLLANSKNDDHP